MELTVKCLAEAMRKAYLDRDRDRGLYKTFAWLVEEVGELAEALRTGDVDKIGEEIADVIAWTVSIAISRFATRKLYEYYGVKAFKVIYHGVIDEFRSPKSKISSRQRRVYKLLLVAHLHEVDNPLILSEALTYMPSYP